MIVTWGSFRSPDARESPRVAGEALFFVVEDDMVSGRATSGEGDGGRKQELDHPRDATDARILLAVTCLINVPLFHHVLRLI